MKPLQEDSNMNMKSLLLATVAAFPLIAAGTLAASSQDIKQQSGSGLSQSQGRGEAPGKRVPQQGKVEQSTGKSQGLSQRGAAPEKSGEARNSAGASRTEGRAPAGQEHAQDQLRSKQQDQARSKPDIKQGQNQNRTVGEASSGKEKVAPKAGNQAREDRIKGKQNEALSSKQPARTSGEANRPNADNTRQTGQAGNRTEGRVESNGRVTLDESQRTKVEQTVLARRDVPRVDRVDFSVNVGTAVPTRIRMAEVPETLIEIHPEWRAHRYFVVRDEIVIVDRSHRIVAVVPLGSGFASSTEIRTTSGASDVEIRRVQEVLSERGFYHGKIDGVLTRETREALITFQRRQGIEATGRIDIRTSQALGISASGRTEGRFDQGRENGRLDQRQGRAEPNGARTSGQAGPSKPSEARDVNGRGVNLKGNQGIAAQEKREGPNSRSSTSGQTANPSKAETKRNNAHEKAAPSTSGQATRPSAGESKPSGEAGGSKAPSTQPQRQSAPGNAGGASDNHRKQPQ
jgi:Protein of unknown function (DUF1236)/Putative peptidoglycan binding domain